MKSMLLTAAMTAAFASLVPVAMAQSTDSTVVAQATQQRAQEGPGAQRQARARHFRMPSERVEARLAYVRTALKITDAQQPQWENFANVMRKHARAMDQRLQERHARFEAARGARGEGARRPDGRNVNAIDRLERTQQRMAERSARLSEVITAAKPLYAALSPEQKQIADGMLAHQGRGGHQQHNRGMNRGPAA